MLPLECAFFNVRIFFVIPIPFTIVMHLSLYLIAGHSYAQYHTQYLIKQKPNTKTKAKVFFIAAVKFIALNEYEV